MAQKVFKLFLLIFTLCQTTNQRKIKYSNQCLKIRPQGSQDDIED